MRVNIRSLSPIQRKSSQSGGSPGQGQRGKPIDPDELDRKIRDQLNDPGDQGGKSDKGGKSGKSDQRNQKDEKLDLDQKAKNAEKNYKDWTDILSKMFSSESEIITTYSRPSRSNVINQGKALQNPNEPLAIKPGEKPGEPLLKVAFVFDTSGSLQDFIPKILANAQNLIDQKSDILNPSIALAYFSGGYSLYIGNIKDDQAVKIKSFSDIENPKNTTAPPRKLSELFREHSSGTTSFSNGLLKEIKWLLNNEYNVLLFTDTDIIWPGNKENFDQIKRIDNFFTLFPTKEIMTAVLAGVGMKASIPENFGTMES